MLIPREFSKLLKGGWREAAVYGGRYSLKSHTVARILLVLARQKKMRIGCFREMQNSIADSSHQLLKDLIEHYDLKDFKVTDNAIINTVNGSDFLFKGLYRNEQSVKSIEGLDIGWVEEAQSVSEKSIEVLTPTIRKPGSRIIYTYNRQEEEDAVHKRLVLDGRPDTLVIKVDYTIAEKYGWLPEEVKKEIEDDKAKRPGLFKHKWLGEPEMFDESRIYTGWQIIDEIPHEARLERYGLDFGWKPDPSSLVGVYFYNGGYILHEVRTQLEWPNREIAETLKNIPRAITVGDCNELKSISEISMYGINIIPCQKSPDSVRHGVKVVQDLKISVTKSSMNLIKGYRTWRRARDIHGNIISGKFEHEPDPLAASRYALETLVPVHRKQEIRRVMGEALRGQMLNTSNNNPV